MPSLSPSRRLPRFRETTTVVLFILMPSVCGCGSRSRLPTAEELAAVAEIQEIGGVVKQRHGQHVTVILGNTDVSDDDLQLLKKLPKLELLNLQNTAITDAGLVHVGELEQLERLSLQKSQVTDAGLAHFAGLKNLVELDLAGLNITDAGLKHLTGLTALEKLYVNADGVTPQGTQDLKQALPKLHVFRNP